MAVDHTWFRPENVQHEFITQWHPEQVYAGGVGCVHPDTLIFDPVLGRSEPISDLREPGHVLALCDGEVVFAERTAAFAKGIAQLYRFQAEHGAIVATGSHLFLTSAGWRPGDDLSPGDSVLISTAMRHPPEESVLLSKTEFCTGEFWDLHVPFYENYWAHGFWNHNSGKTLSGGIKALMATQQWPGGVGLVGRQTYRALEDTTKKVLLYGDDKPAIFVDGEYGNYVAKDDKFVCRNGSEVLFRALEDHNIEKLLSLNLAWVYVDEMTETTLKIWLTLLGRLRHPAGPGCAWGTTNPNGHDWVWRRFHEDAGNTDPDRKLWIQPTMSNPHLPRHYLKRMLGMPEEWKKRFVFASFETAAGMIWDRFDSKIHTFDPMTLSGGDRFPAHWKRFESMDHGRRNPTAWLWFVMDPDGFLVVEDEYYEARMLPSEHAPAINAQRQSVAANIRWGASIAPPDCFRQGNDGRTVADEYRDATGAAIILTLGNDNVEAGLLRVSEWFQRDKDLDFPEWHPWARTKGPDGLGSPRLFISKRCANLIREIPDYRWKDLSTQAEANQDQPEAPRKKDDHACDALRYGVMSRPRPAQVLTADDIDRRATVAAEDMAPTAGLIDMTF